MALGDYQTAVGFLLASAPERSSRFYRDALCTMALAVRILDLAFPKLSMIYSGPKGYFEGGGSKDCPCCMCKQ